MNDQQDPFDYLEKTIRKSIHSALNKPEVKKLKDELDHTVKSVLGDASPDSPPDPSYPPPPFPPGSPYNSNPSNHASQPSAQNRQATGQTPPQNNANGQPNQSGYQSRTAPPPPPNPNTNTNSNPYGQPSGANPYGNRTPPYMNYNKNKSNNNYSQPNKKAYTPSSSNPYLNKKSSGDGSYTNPHTGGRYDRSDLPSKPSMYGKSGLPAKRKTPSTSVGGILMIVFGSIGAVVSGLGSIATAVGTMVTGVDNIALTTSLAILLALFAGCAGVIGKGISLCSRTKRYKRYLEEIGSSQMCPIEALAAAVGRSKKFVAKDLLKMIRSGFFPDARLDSKKTTLILDSETYRQYLKAEEKMRELQKKGKEKLPKPQKEEEPASTGNPELDAVLKEGRKYIDKIKFANDMIPEEDISNKIDRLEQVSAKIFEYVAEHPKKLPDIRRFMSYYLPTTLKLLDAYCQFDAQPIQGENITLAKREIHETLDTINVAFENLLDNLFKDVALDISTDISAMEAMMAQEGLTDSDFKNTDDKDKFAL